MSLQAEAVNLHATIEDLELRLAHHKALAIERLKENVHLKTTANNLRIDLKELRRHYQLLPEDHERTILEARAET